MNMEPSTLFYNAWELVQSNSFFLNIFIGGRGIGKTYSILKGLLNQDSKFMYVRRTETEIKNCCKDVNNPFNALNADLERNIEVSPSGDMYIIHEDDNMLGLAGALSTFGKFRGGEYQYIDYIFFDEFISKRKGGGSLNNEDEVTNFFDMLETVQRNREILGKKPIKVIMASNSNTLNSGIISELKLADVIRIMKVNKIEHWEDIERGIMIEYPKDVPISKKKTETALYKLTKGTSFYQMAIENEFVNDDFTIVRKLPSNSLIPVVAYNDVYFYVIKNQNKLYCTFRKAKCKIYTDKTKKQFIREYGIMLGAYLDSNSVLYYSYDLKIIVDNIFK